MRINPSAASLALCIWFAGIALAAQDAPSQPTLTWDAVRFAYRYEVTFEKYDAGLNSFSHALSIQTEDTTLQIPLGEGVYRYKITVFNLLGKADSETGWRPLTIRRAYQPNITLVRPKKVYLKKPKLMNFSFRVENFFDESAVFLRGGALGDSTQEIIPERIELKGNTLKLGVTLPTVGEYEAHVINPGGLSASSEKIIASQFRPWLTSIAFSPPFVTAAVPLYGEDFINEYGNRPNFFAAKARLTLFPWEISEMQFCGFEIQPVWFYQKRDIDAEITSVNSLGININAAYQQYFLQKKLALILRAGLGISFFSPPLKYTYKHQTDEDAVSVALSFNAGATLEWFFSPRFFAEAAVDFSAGGFGLLIPSLGIGAQF